MKKYILLSSLIIKTIVFAADYWPLERQNYLGDRILGDFIESKPENITHTYHPRGIYPVGWSENGFFAFVIQLSMGEVGVPKYEFVIMDLVTDEKIYYEKVDIERVANYFNGDSQSYNKIVNDRDIWLIESTNFRKALENNNVIYMQSPLLKFDNSSYNIKIEHDIYSEENLSTIRSFSIFLINKDNKYKKVTNNDLSFDITMSRNIGTSCYGYFKSPYEDRIAILYGIWDTGWEGYPWVDLYVTGSHTTYGFK